MKISIIGCPGSGKSTLAFRLQKKQNIPLYHLDQYFWSPGWQRPDRDDFKKVHDQLCDKDQWIIEGMATRYLEYRVARSDVIIYLDIPWYVCLYRVFKRAFLNFGKVSPASAKGCPESIPSREFLSYVWNFSKKQKFEAEAILSVHSDKDIYIVKNQKDLEAVIKTI